MKEVQDLPEEGQFVVVWEYNNKIWSGTFKWKNENLFIYLDGFLDSFFVVAKIDDLFWFYDENCQKKFFVIE